MNNYQFEKIFSVVGKEIGKFAEGEQEPYTQVFFAIDSNCMKVHRAFPASNGRRLEEALALALHEIRGRYTATEPDVSSFRNEDNERLEHAILMAVDPYTNPDIMELLTPRDVRETGKPWEPAAEKLRAFYEIPVKCLLRIKKSVDLWQGELGPDGYFDFMEHCMGELVPEDDQMDFAIAAPL